MAANLKIGADVGDVKPLRRFTKAIKDQANAIRDYTQASNAAPKSGVAYGSVSGGGSSRGGSRNAGGGPFSKQRTAQTSMAQAMASGDPTAIRDAMFNLRKATAAATRAQNSMAGRGTPDPATKLNTWARSSRFGTSGGMMPLAGQSLDLLGLGQMAGPIAITTLAIVAMGKAAKFFTEMALERTRNTAGLGGGAKGESNATSTALGAGVDPEDVRALGERAQAAAYDGSNAGVELRARGFKDPGFGPNRNPDRAGAANDALKIIAEMPNGPAKRRLIQDLGAEKFAPLLDLEKGQQEKIRGGSLDTPINRILKQLGMGWTLTPRRFKPGEQMAPGAYAPKTPEAVREYEESQKENAPQTTALNANTQALVRLAATMERQIFGGGAQAQGALPKNWNFETLSQIANAKEAYALGAFGM